jgi:hypothetical protein
MCVRRQQLVSTSSRMPFGTASIRSMSDSGYASYPETCLSVSEVAFFLCGPDIFAESKVFQILCDRSGPCCGCRNGSEYGTCKLGVICLFVMHHNVGIDN